MFILESNYLKRLHQHIEKIIPQTILLTDVAQQYFTNHDLCLIDEDAIDAQKKLQHFDCQIIVFVSDPKEERPGFIYKYQPMTTIVEKIMGRHMNITYVCNYNLSVEHVKWLQTHMVKMKKDAYHISLLLTDATDINIFDYAIASEQEKENLMQKAPHHIRLFSNLQDYVSPCEDAILDFVKRCAIRKKTYLFTDFIKNQLDQNLLMLSSKVILLCSDKSQAINPSFLYAVKKNDATFYLAEFEEFKAVINKEDKRWEI